MFDSSFFPYLKHYCAFLSLRTKNGGTIELTSQLSNKVVLVVDDIDALRRGTAANVRSLGFDADEAPNGVVALRMMQQFGYAVVLMDLSMPHMDGLECTARIREAEKSGSAKTRIPIIFLSAVLDDDEAEKCLKAGAMLV